MIFVEPDYRRNRDGSKVDYTKVPAPVRPPVDRPELVGVFDTWVRGHKVYFKVSEGLNEYDIPAYRIRDLSPSDPEYPQKVLQEMSAEEAAREASRPSYADTLYRYKTRQNPDVVAVTPDVFMEFFSKATMELTRRLEEKKRMEEGDHWKPPVIQHHDGQTLPLSLWHAAFYAGQPSGITQAEIDYLKQFPLVGTTHTIKNRGVFGDWDFVGDYESIVKLMGVPEDLLWTLARKAVNGKGEMVSVWDGSSGGVRTTRVSQGVSAIHADKMARLDPGLLLYALTNGSNRAFSMKHLFHAMQDPDLNYWPRKPEKLIPEEVAKVKRKAKTRLSERIKDIDLNPDQMVVSYSGRLVEEKAGRKKAFTNENVIEMVKQGMQVVIFGNVQPYKESTDLAADLVNLRDRILQLKEKDPDLWPGQFIFKPGFSIDEQLQLLAATDVQVQYSDLLTGAAEYTESDVGSNGGLQLSPPYWEGIIGKQGVVVNWDEMTGNTLVPKADTPQAVLETIMNAKNLYDSKDPQKHLSVLQSQALKISRVLEAKLTAAAYLRVMNAAIQRGSSLPAKRQLAELEARNIQDVRLTVPGAAVETTEAVFNVVGKGKGTLQVAISLKVFNELDKEREKKARKLGKPYRGEIREYNLSPDLLLAQVVDDDGKIIRLHPQRDGFGTIIVQDGNVFFSADIETYPFQGHLEISSGMWWTSRPLRISNLPASQTRVEIEEEVKGKFKVRQVSPITGRHGNRIVCIDKMPVVMEIEFPWEHEELKDEVVVVMRSNVFGDWDDVSEDQFLFSDLQYEKYTGDNGNAHGKFVWRMAFTPSQSGELTFYVTLKGDPESKIWHDKHGQNLIVDKKPFPETAKIDVPTHHEGTTAVLTMEGDLVRLIVMNNSAQPFTGSIDLPAALIMAGYKLSEADRKKANEVDTADTRNASIGIALKPGENRQFTFELPTQKGSSVAKPGPIDEEGSYQNIVRTLRLVVGDIPFPAWETVKGTDGVALTTAFLGGPEIKGNREVLHLLSLIGDVVEQNGFELNQEHRYVITLRLAEVVLKRSLPLPPSQIKALWDELSSLGYAGNFHKLVEMLASMEGKKISQLKSAELTVAHFIAGLRGDKDLRTTLPEAKHGLSENEDMIGDLNNVILQYHKTERTIGILEGKAYKGTVVVDAQDVNVGFYNFISALRKHGVNLDDVKFVLLIKDLDAVQRTELMKGKAPQILLAEDMDDVHAENIVYLTKSLKGNRAKSLSSRGVGLVARGNAGPMLELSLALDLLSAGRIYVLDSPAPNATAVNMYAAFLQTLADNRIIAMDEAQRTLLMADAEKNGCFKLPEVKVFERMWDRMEDFHSMELAA